MHQHSLLNFLTPVGCDRRSRLWSRCWLLTALLLGGSLWSWAIVARAEPLTVLLAQQVVDGLPPPPLPQTQPAFDPLPSGSAIETLPSFAPSSGAAIPAEGQLLPPNQQVQGYAVYVNGDSPLLLEQVRRVESGAFLQAQGEEQVIQAGLFREQASAAQQVANLESQGIAAEVVEVSRTVSAAGVSAAGVSDAGSASIASPIPSATPSANFADRSAIAEASLPTVPVVRYGEPLPTAQSYSGEPANASVPGRSYYVVVPGRTSDLPAISNLVRNLGTRLNVTEDTLQERSSPLGPHILVGPFVNREAASRWNRYFRDFGMDARVYYKR